MVAQGNSISVLYQAFCEMVEKRREGGLPLLSNLLPNFAQTYYNGSVVFMSTFGFTARATLKESVMVSDKATLVNPQGLHMRPAGLFASTMGKFASEVTVVAPDKEVNTYMGETDLWNLKPPLGYWTVMVGYALFGYTSFGLRFVSAVCWIATAFVLAQWLRKHAGLPSSICFILLMVASTRLYEAHLVRTDGE